MIFQQRGRAFAHSSFRYLLVSGGTVFHLSSPRGNSGFPEAARPFGGDSFPVCTFPFFGKWGFLRQIEVFISPILYRRVRPIPWLPLFPLGRRSFRNERPSPPLSLQTSINPPRAPQDSRSNIGPLVFPPAGDSVFLSFFFPESFPSRQFFLHPFDERGDFFILFSSFFFGWKWRPIFPPSDAVRAALLSEAKKLFFPPISFFPLFSLL